MNGINRKTNYARKVYLKSACIFRFNMYDMWKQAKRAPPHLRKGLNPP